MGDPSRAGKYAEYKRHSRDSKNYQNNGHPFINPSAVRLDSQQFVQGEGNLTHEYIMFIRNISLSGSTMSNHFISNIQERLSMYGHFQLFMNQSETSCKILLSNPPSMPDFFSVYEKDNFYLCGFKVIMFRDVSRELFQYPEMDWKKLKARVILTSDFNSQIEVIKVQGLLTEESLEKRRKLALFLECLLVFGDFDCTVLPFGSTVTGLGFNDTDLDLFINMREHNHKRERMQRKHALTRLDFIHRFLRSQLKMYIMKPIDCRHPIIKLDFSKLPRTPRGISVDISIAGMLGVYNSKLIDHLSRTEPLFKDLAAAVKYWMKCNDMIGPNCITSYGCLLMCIFYLQSILVLPSMVELQYMCLTENIEGKWNVAFPREDNSMFPYCNQSLVRPKLSSVFLGFFNFYAKFSFNNRAISPFLGRSHTKTEINRDFGIKATSITIQDMIQHDSNVGQNVANDFFDSFLSIVRFINYEISRQTSADDDVVAKTVYSVMIEKLDVREGKVFQKIRGPDQNKLRPYLLISQQIPLNMIQSRIEKWSKRAVDAIEKTLCDVLKFTLYERRDLIDLSDPNRIPLRQCFLSKFIVTIREDQHCVWMERTKTINKKIYGEQNQNNNITLQQNIAAIKNNNDYVNEEKQLTEKIREYHRKRQESKGEDGDDNDVVIRKDSSGRLSDTVVSFDVLINSANESQFIEIIFDHDKQVNMDEKIWYKEIKTFLSNYVLEHVQFYYVRDQAPDPLDSKQQ
jgi:hypothetical protein